MTKQQALQQASAAKAAGFAIFEIQLLMRAAGVSSADELSIITELFGAPKKVNEIERRALRAAINAEVGI